MNRKQLMKKILIPVCAVGLVGVAAGTTVVMTSCGANIKVAKVEVSLIDYDPETSTYKIATCSDKYYVTAYTTTDGKEPNLITSANVGPDNNGWEITLATNYMANMTNLDYKRTKEVQALPGMASGPSDIQAGKKYDVTVWFGSAKKRNDANPRWNKKTIEISVVE